MKISKNRLKRIIVNEIKKQQLKTLREFAPAPLIVLAPIVITTAIEIEMAIVAVTAIAAIFGITAGVLLTYLNEKKEAGNTTVTLGDLGDEFGEIKNKEHVLRLNELKGKTSFDGGDVVREISSIVKERPKTIKRPKVDINDLLNPDNEVDDEEREGETIPVYCFKCKSFSTGKVWWICFKSKKRMIQIYETYNFSYELVMDGSPDFIVFKNQHPLSSMITQFKIRNWVGCKSGSSISFEDYSNGPGVRWIPEGLKDEIVNLGIRFEKYMSDEPEITEYPC